MKIFQSATVLVVISIFSSTTFYGQTKKTRCLPSDVAALLEFKNSINDPENILSSWSNESRCCEWRGIGCNNITGAVTMINLRGGYPYRFDADREYGSWYLSGEINPSLLQLKSLQYLDLSSNSFEYIPIPKFFGSLTDLRYLNLSGAGFGGIIPPSLGNLSHLEYLDVSNLPFTMIADSFEWIRGLVSLKHLSMNQMKLSLVNPNWLEMLNTLHHLTELHLSSCQLSGSISNLMSPVNFTSLAVIDLSMNGFSSKFPRWLANISSLVYVDFRYCMLRGRMQLGLGDLPNLRVLDLSSNNLIGSIPPSIGQKCPHLNVLDLGDNSLSDEIPESTNQLNQLQSLHLNDNFITGNMLSSLKNLSSLETLDLQNNKLNGNIPSWLGESSPRLRILNLRSNSFSGKIPFGLTDLRSLQVLDLSENNLSGKIPSSLGCLKAITRADRKTDRYFSYGRYSGVFYQENTVIYNKNQLQTFTETLHLVKAIDLSGNNLSGDIPIELTELRGLMILNLSRNHITGQIPVNILNLQQLASLDLSSNDLSGLVPPSMAWLSFLGYLNLSDNDLSGKIPYEGHLSTFSSDAFGGNPGLCGAPLSVNCPNEDTSDEKPPSENQNVYESRQDGFIDRWFYLNVGLGFVVGILVPHLVMVIRRSWSEKYLDLVDMVFFKLLSAVGNKKPSR